MNIMQVIKDMFFIVIAFIPIIIVIFTIFFLWTINGKNYYKKSCEDPLRYVYDGYYHKYVDGIGCLSDKQYKRYMDTIK